MHPVLCEPSAARTITSRFSLSQFFSSFQDSGGEEEIGMHASDSTFSEAIESHKHIQHRHIQHNHESSFSDTMDLTDLNISTNSHAVTSIASTALDSEQFLEHRKHQSMQLHQTQCEPISRSIVSPSYNPPRRRPLSMISTTSSTSNPELPLSADRKHSDPFYKHRARNSFGIFNDNLPYSLHGSPSSHTPRSSGYNMTSNVGGSARNSMIQGSCACNCSGGCCDIYATATAPTYFEPDYGLLSPLSDIGDLSASHATFQQQTLIPSSRPSSRISSRPPSRPPSLPASRPQSQTFADIQKLDIEYVFHRLAFKERQVLEAKQNLRDAEKELEVFKLQLDAVLTSSNSEVAVLETVRIIPNAGMINIGMNVWKYNLVVMNNEQEPLKFVSYSVDDCLDVINDANNMDTIMCYSELIDRGMLLQTVRLLLGAVRGIFALLPGYRREVDYDVPRISLEPEYTAPTTIFFGKFISDV